MARTTATVKVDKIDELILEIKKLRKAIEKQQDKA